MIRRPRLLDWSLNGSIFQAKRITGWELPHDLLVIFWLHFVICGAQNGLHLCHFDCSNF